MIDICPSGKCTACGACLNVCGKAAITMQEDEWGYRFPAIEVSRCVNCGLCREVCPNNRVLSYHTSRAALIAKAADVDEQKSSVSVFSRFIIRRGGVVYGCSGVDGKHVRHIRVHDEAGLDALKGSKYVQSDIGATFRQVKKDLIIGVTVLFIGTPCQVAGLLSFLQKPYERLFTIDFVCHGVPSQRLLDEAMSVYVDGVKSYSIAFRRKMNCGKSRYGVFISQGGGSVAARYFPRDNYIVGFLQGLYYRESCYDCSYSRVQRVADMTVGDYWDRENRCKDLCNKQYGLSMLMVYTGKGEALYTECKDLLHALPGDLETFTGRNAQLVRPMRKHPLYDRFRGEYLLHGFQYAANLCLVADKKRIHRSLFVARLSFWIYKVPFMKRLYNLIKRK